LAAEKYINASCAIGNNTIYKNGVPVFDNRATDTAGFLSAAYSHFNAGYPKFYKMDNLCKLGWLASEVLLNGSFNPAKYRPEDVGFVLSNANSSLDTDLKFITTLQDIPSPSVFVYTLPNIVTGEICIRNNFKGENAFFISDEFDAGFIHKYVSNLLDNNILQACIFGWVELVGDAYKAVLFLGEKEPSANAVALTEENIHKIFLANDE